MWKTFDRLVTWMAALSRVFVAFIVVSICAEVFLRYLFHRPLMWTVEISEYLQLYLAFLSAAWVLRENGHVRLDIFLSATGPTARRVLNFIGNLVGLSVAFAIMIFSAVVTGEEWVRGTPVIKALEVPKWIVLVPIPVGSFLLAIEFVRHLLRAGREN